MHAPPDHAPMAKRADLDRGKHLTGHQNGTATLPAEDVLVFEAQPDGFKLIGGQGRGAGWANVVELRMVENPTVAQAWKVALPVRAPKGLVAEEQLRRLGRRHGAREQRGAERARADACAQRLDEAPGLAPVRLGFRPDDADATSLS